MVRVLPLRHRGDARVQPDHVPARRQPLHARHSGVPHVRGRLRRPPARRHRLRPLRRQVRPQEAAAARDHPRRRRDLPHGMPSHLRPDRHLGHGPPRRAALRAGLRGRRRMGRRRPAGRGALPRPQPRLLGVLPAGGRPDRQPARDGRPPRAQQRALARGLPRPGAGAWASGCPSSSSRSATTSAPASRTRRSSSSPSRRSRSVPRSASACSRCSVATRAWSSRRWACGSPRTSCTTSS